MEPSTDRVSIWASRDYVWWLAGDTTGMIGRVFSLLIVSFVVYDLTGSEGSAGTLQTIILVLMLIASIPGGIIVDRMDRRKLIYIYSIFGSVVSAGIFAYIYSGNLTYLSFTILMSILGLVHGFFGEVTNASLRSIMSGPGYVKAQAANQGRDAAVQLLARPLSGFLYGIFAWLPFLVSTVFCAIQGLFFSRIQKSLVPTDEEATETGEVVGEPVSSTAEEQVPVSVASADLATSADQVVSAHQVASASSEKSHDGGAVPSDSTEGAKSGAAGEAHSNNAGGGAAPKRGTTMVQEFIEGLGYLTSRRVLLTLAVIITLINLGMAGVQSLMVLSLIAQGYAAVEVGYLGVATGVAVIMSSTVAGRIAEKYATGTITVLSLIWFTATTVPLLFSDGYWVAMGVSFALGLCVPIANAALLGYLLGRTPERFQGRVSSAINIVAQGLSAFAPLIAGLVLEAYDYRVVAIIFVAVSLLSVVIAIASSRVRSIPTPSEWERYD